jgi:hypothetical protein
VDANELISDGWRDAIAFALVAIILVAAGFALGYVSGMQRQLDDLCSTRAGQFYLREECK